MLLVIVTGLLLQVKKQVSWVQPPTESGQSRDKMPAQNWEAILNVASSVAEAEVSEWKDIDRLDVRPGKGIVKVQSSNHWELQIDLESGEVLSSKYRRSDWIEQLHDGSFFSDAAKLWVFLPNGLILLGLWTTGVWMWYLPFSKRRKRKSETMVRL